MDSRLNGDIPSEMLYVEVGENRGEGDGIYAKIEFIKMTSVQRKTFPDKHGRLGKPA